METIKATTTEAYFRDPARYEQTAILSCLSLHVSVSLLRIKLSSSATGVKGLDTSESPCPGSTGELTSVPLVAQG